eukprot:5310239-Amphidinium_carterae.2
MVAACLLGLASLVAYVRAKPHTSDFYIHGFTRLSKELKLFLVLGAAVSYVGDALRALVLEDSRLCKCHQHAKSAVLEELLYLESLPHAVVAWLARFCDRSVLEVRDAMLCAGHTSFAFIHLACLPSEPVVKYDFGDALRSMTPLFEARDVLSTVCEKTCPKSSAPSGDRAVSLGAIDRVLAEESILQDGGKKLLTGKGANVNRLKKLKRQDLSKADPEALHGVAPFAWLLSDADKKSLEEAKKTLIKEGNLRVCKASATGVAKPTKKQKGDDMKATLDLFA